MRKRYHRFAPALFGLVLLLLGAPLCVVGAQHAVEAPWVRYEQGVHAFGEGRLGDALRHFRAAASEAAPFPEAEFGIGRVFQAEGSFDLALRHYRLALDNEHRLDPPETAVLIRYQIAEIHRLRGNIDEFERILTAIAEADPVPRDTAAAGRPEAHLSVLRTQGIDRLMVLYRIHEGFSHRARRDLGVHMADSDRFGEALPHLIAAAMQGLSTVADDLRRIRFDYRWTDLFTVLTDAWDHDHLRDYIEREELFRTLYYLGLALEAVDSDSAHAIWRALALLPVADDWHRLALRRVPSATIRRR